MSSAVSRSFSENNFDLIRLFAAAQVAHFHVFHILGVQVSAWHAELIRFLGLFPGVPIFFFISGFLISKAWEKNPSVKLYAINRVLRIYPGLLLVVLLSFFLINVTGYVARVQPSLRELLTLFVTSSTFLQFYNPDFMRGYGDGVMNGSLWTISVELQFYVLVPLLYWVFGRFRSVRIEIFLIALWLIFLAVNMVYSQHVSDLSGNIYFKLFGVSFAPWFYMFLLGVIFQRNFQLIHGWLSGRFLHCLALYLLVAHLARWLGADFGNAMTPVVFLFLAPLIFSAAYTAPGASRVLGGVDVSYGLYIYHMPFVNLMLYVGGYGGGYLDGFLVAAMTIAMSLVSWLAVERVALKFKPRTIRSQDVSQLTAVPQDVPVRQQDHLR